MTHDELAAWRERTISAGDPGPWPSELESTLDGDELLYARALWMTARVEARGYRLWREMPEHHLLAARLVAEALDYAGVRIAEPTRLDAAERALEDQWCPVLLGLEEPA